MKLWKSMQAGLKSKHGATNWKIGEWQKVTAPLELCSSGFHASENIIDAMGFVNCEILARVEVRGKHLKETDKQCWSEMRILKVCHWEKNDSVRLAIFAAESVIANYERVYPDDNRPRLAIEAAKAYLHAVTPQQKTAAITAAWSAAESAESAARSAESAARSAAWSAAESAESARSAAWSAESAARSAWSAARSAQKQCHNHVLKIIKGRMVTHI